MKPKYICDGTNEDLKELLDQGESVFAIHDNIGGCSVMDHNNMKGWVILSEKGYGIMEEQLKENECWDDLSLLITAGYKKDFEEFQDLKKFVENLNEN